jgi:hypothetical protein
MKTGATGRRLLSAIALVLVASACGGGAFRGPEQGGRQWLRASSPHFTLLSSQSEASTRDSLQALEVTHATFERVAFPSADQPRGTTEIVILSAEEFDALKAAGASHQNAIGYFYAAGPGNASHPRCVVRDDLGPAALATTPTSARFLPSRDDKRRCPRPG